MSEQTVLLVDDIPEYLDTMEINLPEGYRALRASSAQQARYLAGTEPFDLAVVDVRLKEQEEPNREGLDLLKWLREHHAKAPVIVISAYREFEFEAEALAMGAEFFLRKPIQPEEFRRAVNRSLDRP